MALSKSLSPALQQVRLSREPIGRLRQSITKRSFHLPSRNPRTRTMDRSNYFIAHKALPRLYSNSTYHNPGAGTQILIWSLIGINGAVFYTWYSARTKQDRKLLKQLDENAILSWKNIDEGRYHTIITSAFSHQSFGHFFFNMFGLLVYGGILASRGVRPATTLALTLGCGVAGSAAWLYEHRDQKGLYEAKGGFLSRLSQRQPTTLYGGLGASGIVMGAAAAATCVAPWTGMSFILLPMVPIPLWVWTTGYVALDIYYMDPASRVGHSAHLGGTAFGVLFYLLRLRHFGGVANMLRFR